MTPELINPVKDEIFDSELVRSAYNFAQKSHEGQFRKSGEPYFSHCEAVYKILKDEWGVKSEAHLAAALLHDTIEDCDVPYTQLKNQFGEATADLVAGVTKLKSSTDKETLKEVLDKSYINPGVALIKLADRLHNMRTLEFMPPKKQVVKSRETLDVYTRLAESLGLWKAKIELEDLCFKYLESNKYQQTLTKLESDSRLSPNFVNYLTSRIEQLLLDNRINGHVETRKNGCWTINKKKEKMALKGKGDLHSFHHINDLISFRVQLNTISDCYQALHQIHHHFGDMVDYDRFDEFIGANKRINGYQALQTTVNFPQGSVEIAIMTKEMEEFNNNGIVNLINNHQDTKDYVLKLVFTPTETVRFLPKNATGVDFATIINPRVLAQAKSMNVDGVDKPLSAVIPNASTVRINLDDEPRRAPLEGLEDYCLPQTRKIIEGQRILQSRDELISEGKQKLESVLIPRGLIVLSDIGDSVNPLLYKLGCQSIDDLYFMVGNDSIKTDYLSQELDLAGITKENLKITSIRLIGPDRPKVLINVIKKISDMDRNIVHIEQKNENNQFNIRLLVQDMTPKEEKHLREYLSNDSKFIHSLVA